MNRKTIAPVLRHLGFPVKHSLIHHLKYYRSVKKVLIEKILKTNTDTGC